MNELSPHAELSVGRSKKPLVWLLLGSRRGDNNQMLALAKGLGLPFEKKSLDYNRLRCLVPFRSRLLHLSAKSRQLIRPPWPQLVIGLGANSLPVARYVRRKSGGMTRLVHIGDPRSSIADLDLLITTPQFAAREAFNVLRLELSIGNPAHSVTASQEEDQWLSRFPRPRRLVALGGATRKWKLDGAEVERAVEYLQSCSARDGGSVIAVTSPRTTKATERMLRERLVEPSAAVVGDFPRFAVLLAECDEVHVTADSVSMLSEAVLSGRPVGMISISPTLRGRISQLARRFGLPHRVDMSNFWRFLIANKLVGSVEQPLASQTDDTVPIAVAAVQRVLQEPPTLPRGH